MIFGSLILNNRRIPIDQVEPDVNIEYGSTSVQFTGAQTNCGELSQGHYLYYGRSEWYNGKTYYCYQGPHDSDGDSMGYIIEYDENDGIKRPLRINQPNVLTFLGTHDTHPTPAIKVDASGNLYMFQERSHDTPIDLYKGLNDPVMLAEKIAPGTGALAELSYPQIFFDGDDNAIMICRMTALGLAYSGGHLAVVRASNGMEGWGAQVRLTTNPNPQTGSTVITGKTRHYPNIPWYRQRAGGYIYWGMTVRTDDGVTFLGRWNTYHIFKTPETDRAFIDIMNVTGIEHTHDMTGNNYMTQTILNDHFLVYDSGGIANNAFMPIWTIDQNENIYMIHGDENTGELLLNTIIGRVQTIQSLDIIGYAVSDPEVSQNHSVNHIIYVDNYLEIGILMGTYPTRRTHIFRSFNQGASWIDYGDVAPEVANETRFVIYPVNYHEIPQNRNFMIAVLNDDLVTASRQNVFLKRVAKGEIQPETPNIVVPAASYSDAFNVRHYKFDSASVTKTGNNITAFTDQFGIANATCTNNPQWSSVDNSITFNGTNNFANILTTGLTALTKMTMIVVAKGPLIVLSLNNNLVASARHYYQVGAPGGILIGYKESSGSSLFEDGLTAANDGNWNIFTFVTINNKYDIYWNERKEFYRSVGYSTLAHYNTRGKMNFGTVNSCCIGKLDSSSTDTFSQGSMKVQVIKNTVYDYETQRSLVKKVADEYGITLNYGFQ